MRSKYLSLKSLRTGKPSKQNNHTSITYEEPVAVENEPLSTELVTNERILRSVFEDCSDVVFRPIQWGGKTNLQRRKGASKSSPGAAR